MIFLTVKVVVATKTTFQIRLGRLSEITRGGKGVKLENISGLDESSSGYASLRNPLFNWCAFLRNLKRNIIETF